jgi:hypothetical protein
MSKQSEAKEAQNCRKQPLCCQYCNHFSLDYIEVKKTWLIKPVMTEKNLRCTLGGFAVNKTASCDRFERAKG